LYKEFNDNNIPPRFRGRRGGLLEVSARQIFNGYNISISGLRDNLFFNRIVNIF
jgi:hypothetical protein